MSVAQDCNQAAFPFAIIDGIFTDLYSVLIDKSTREGSFSVVEIEIVLRDNERVSKIKNALTTTCYSIKKIDDPMFIFKGQMVDAVTIDNKLRVEIENIANSEPSILSVSFQTDTIVSADSITEAREAIA